MYTTAMGVLSRRRSLLVKLAVVVTTAWFTVAFLLYSENQGTPVALAQRGNFINERANEIDVAEVVENKDDERKQADSAVLAPPQNLAGEMGKPVVLPANLSGW